MLARRFLWIVAGLTLLVVAGALLYRLFEPQLMKLAMVPTAHFETAPAVDPHAYDRADMWIARPDVANNPSLWTPPGVKRSAQGRAEIFFIHPTSYLQKSRWNAPMKMQPVMLIAVISSPEIASTFTNFDEPSIAP